MVELIPIFGMLTGLVITVTAVVGFVKFSHGPVGQAVARRILGRGTAEPDVAADLADLKDQVDILRRQLEETQERLDFTERMLSQGRSPERIPEAQ